MNTTLAQTTCGATKRHFFLRRIAALACLPALYAAASAATLDPSAFAAKIAISFSGYTGSEKLENFPALVKLSAEKGFQYAKCKLEKGGDLRFADADGNLLASEVDTWDPSGTSLVWVKVPELTKTATIFAYYGWKGAGAVPAVTSADVWSEGYVGVWHLGQDSLPLAESSGVGTPFSESVGTSLAYGYSGAIGGALDLHSGNGRSGGVFADDDDDLDGFSDITIECWLRQDVATSYAGYGSLVQKVSSGNADYSYRVYSPLNQRLDFFLSGTGSAPSANGSSVSITSHCNGPALETWFHQAFTYELSNKKSDVYVNGASYWTNTGYWNLGGTIYAGAAKLSIGAGWTTGAMGYEGQIDELRISRTARSADWIRATHDTVAVDGFAEYEAMSIDNDWDNYAKKFTVTFDGAPAGTLVNFPVLVKISESGISGFSYADLQRRKGGDLRFSDENGNLLSSEIDTWDENGTSLVWVKVPALTASTKITAYYGWAEAPFVSGSDVWSEGYVSVWHLGESAAPLVESTGNATAFTCPADGVAPTYATNGIVGKAVDFATNDDNSTKKRLEAADCDALDGFGDFTVEFWSYQETFRDNQAAAILSKRSGYASEESWFLYQNQSSTGWQNLMLAYGHDGGADHRTSGNAAKPPPANAWVHQAFLRAKSDDTWTWYWDGKFVRSGTGTENVNTNVYSGTATLKFGGGGGQYSFPGSIDEVRISNVARNEAWVKASHDTVADAAFATYGKVKEAGQKGMVVFFR